MVIDMLPHADLAVCVVVCVCVCGCVWLCVWKCVWLCVSARAETAKERKRETPRKRPQRTNEDENTRNAQTNERVGPKTNQTWARAKRAFKTPYGVNFPGLGMRRPPFSTGRRARERGLGAPPAILHGV